MRISKKFFPKTFVKSLALLLSLVFSLGGAVALGEETKSISSAPSANGTIDESRSRFSYRLEPGQTVTDDFFVQNSGSVEQKVSVYATDAFNAEDGGFALLDTSETPKDVGSWIVFEGGVSRVDLTLGPGESRVLGFTLAVPAEASPGDHAGGLVVTTQGDGDGQVLVEQRIATRLYARVKGELLPRLAITSVDASYAADFFNPFGGTATITTTLSNTGNVSLGADVTAGVRGVFGIPLAETVVIDVPELLPGSTRTYRFDVPGVGAWTYLNPYIYVLGTIDEDALDSGAMPLLERSISIFVVPWHFLLALVGAALIIVGMRARARHNEERVEQWITYARAQSTEKKGDKK
jgi:dihydroorotate dehydrogenase (fumarate)